jgi:Domain of unknown function (DUF6434)/SAP domain-containing new25
MGTGMSIDRPQRPPIERVKKGAELKDWYWLKTELMNHARMLGISTSGGKFEIIDRIADFLDGMLGSKPPKRTTGKAPKIAGFDWHGAPLSRATQIAANYRNTQNVRRFFTAETGRHFSFNIAFMAWMKANVGKTLGEAAAEWQRVHALTKAGEKPAIPFHNQFNAYVCAFFEDNPGRPIGDARHFWRLKRSLPGHNRYERSDLDLRE